MYWIKRKYRQIKRVLDFIPIIWKGFDFDSYYAKELFKHQLGRMADHMESDRAVTTSAKVAAAKIRTAIRLMEKVENEDYGCEYQDKIKELYGDNALDWNFVDCEDKPEYSELHYEYEKWDNAKEIKEMETKLFRESIKKQKRAHKLLWDFIEHNIQNWWD